MNDEYKNSLLSEEDNDSSTDAKLVEDTFTKSTQGKGDGVNTIDALLANEESDSPHDILEAQKSTVHGNDNHAEVSASRIIKSSERQQKAENTQKVASLATEPVQKKLTIGEIKDLYGEVLLDICIELGRKFVSIEDMLNWQNGAIIRLNKTSGEPVDFLINNQPVAFGEIMMLDERFGVRVTEILSKERLIEKYKDGLYEK